MSDEVRKKLDQAYKGLERETPDRVLRAIRWLRAIQTPSGFVCLSVWC